LQLMERGSSLLGGLVAAGVLLAEARRVGSAERLRCVPLIGVFIQAPFGPQPRVCLNVGTPLPGTINSGGSGEIWGPLGPRENLLACSLTWLAWLFRVLSSLESWAIEFDGVAPAILAHFRTMGPSIMWVSGLWVRNSSRSDHAFSAGFGRRRCVSRFVACLVQDFLNGGLARMGRMCRSVANQSTQDSL